MPTLAGPAVAVPDPRRLVHLQFRRYAGCPICSLHLRAFGSRHEEIAAAGIREVVVFHSGRAALQEHRAGLPFDVVPDPARQRYREFGVERSPWALRHPSTWLAAVRGGWPLRGFRSGPGGHFGLPADFLIDTDGTALAVKYGRHANDQWGVDTVLDLARTHA
jgi:hypothetical protein